MTRRHGLVVIAALLGMSAACSSEESSKMEASPSAWPASEKSRAALHVERWELAGTLADGELFGLGGTTDPTFKIVRVHASIRRGDDGRFAMDVDLPRVWKMEFLPGELPVVSGDIAPDVAYALAASALDAPEAPAARSSGGLLVASLGLQPLDTRRAGSSGGTSSGGTSGGTGLVSNRPTCLVRSTTRLVPGSAEHTRTMEQAFGVLQQFQECRQADGSVPDPNNQGERANYDRCVAAVNRAGCDAAATYRTLLEGQTEQTPTQPSIPSGGGAQPGQAGQPGQPSGPPGTGGAPSTPSGAPTGGPSGGDAQVNCSYSAPGRTAGGAPTRCFRSVVECMTAAACAERGGAASPGPCQATPTPSGPGCGG